MNLRNMTKKRLQLLFGLIFLLSMHSADAYAYSPVAVNQGAEATAVQPAEKVSRRELEMLFDVPSLHRHYSKYLQRTDTYSSFLEFEYELHRKSYRRARRNLAAGTIMLSAAAISAVIGWRIIVNEANEHSYYDEYDNEPLFGDEIIGILLIGLAVHVAIGGTILLIMGLAKKGKYEERLFLMDQYINLGESARMQLSPTGLSVTF